jgi:hypothetical protein
MVILIIPSSLPIAIGTFPTGEGENKIISIGLAYEGLLN